MTTVIEARGLRKEFGVREKAGRLRRVKSSFVALDHLDLTVERGETVGYIGPNGAGKSTTIKMMTGVMMPSGGEITVCGLRPVPQRTTLARRIGVVFGQRSQLWWDLPLRDSFELLRHIYRVPAAEHAATLARCRSMLELDEFASRPVRHLSLGQRMRGEITAALLHNPEILFLDEPTIGLDVTSKQAVREFLRTVAATGDTTLVLTTHDLADIEQLCERLVVIDHGRLVHDGTLDALHERYGSRRRVIVEVDAPLDAATIAAIAAGVPGVETEEAAPGGLTAIFTLSGTASAGALIAALAASTSLRDLSIVEPDIEDVISRLYAG